MQFSYVDKIIGQWRYRDFCTLLDTLRLVADGDIDYMLSKMEYINRAHAENMRAAAERLRRCAAIKPSEIVMTPLQIVEISSVGSSGYVIRHTIPGTDDFMTITG